KDWFGNPVTSFGSKSQLRRYGGDLQGVLDQIPYLDSLGITAVYFNPVNDAPSLHKYDPRYWRHVDRNFGPDPRGDVKLMAEEVHHDPITWKFTAADQMFLKVIEALHQRGIRVIMDYSWNHTGHRFWAWNDLVKNQEQSRYKDWYWVNSFDDPTTAKNEFDYQGWFGVKDLPEIRETAHMDHSDMIAIDTTGNVFSEDAKQHIFNVARRWLDPNGDGDPSDGVDGYRLDVAAEMPFGFWREFRQVVREVRPDAYLIGEVWWEKWPDGLMDPEPFLRGDVFDAQMNYRWYRAARLFFNASPHPLKVTDFVDSLKNQRSHIRKGNNYAMMNLNGSHDTPRVLTSLYNKNKYKFNTHPDEKDTYRVNKPDAKTFQTLRLLLAHQFTYIGAPHIWAGDEMGMWGTDDPSSRKPLIWPDYTFEPETTHPFGISRPRDEVAFDVSLFRYYQRLIKIRKENPVLRSGKIDFILADNEKEILAYRRYDYQNEIIAVFNSSTEAQPVTLNLQGKYEELLSMSGVMLSDDFSLQMPARSTAILVKK
ncbi:MAG: alpha-amylase family glycosyl hydrolase, partial [Bacteroidota bacterium]